MPVEIGAAATSREMQLRAADEIEHRPRGRTDVSIIERIDAGVVDAGGEPGGAPTQIAYRAFVFHAQRAKDLRFRGMARRHVERI